MGGVTQSSFGTNSRARTRPPIKSPTRTGQKIDAGVPIEMMQEVSEQHDVIALAPIDVECAAANGPIALGDAGGRRILVGDREDRRPVDGSDLKAGNGLRR